MLKKLLPFEELFYHSSLTNEELISRLQNEIEAEKSFSFKLNYNSYTKPYIGTMSHNNFKIKRAISYRNSFLPIIEGKITSDISGSKINIKMHLEEFVKVFMIIWLGGVLFACIAISYAYLFTNKTNTEDGGAIIIPFGMLAIGLFMVSAGFKSESKKSIKDLEEILQAKIIKP
ncbi:hypothetical protein [Flavobacterium mesophilum]|uniref:hypothetical protein n=1 Tax=Flavobacterium mesophilum TaxID=3143495 RepID=UPI0031D285FE